jgi:hypothetical protein
MPCEEWTAFYSGDDKVAKRKIVQMRKILEEEGFQKYAEEEK